MVMLATDYESLLEELARLSDELRALGEKEDSGEPFTEDDQARWEELDAAYEEAMARKTEEDTLRQTIERKERLESLDKNKRVRRNVPAPLSSRRNIIKRPPHMGRLQAFRGDDAADQAYDFGLWLRGTLFNDKRSLEMLDDRAGKEYRQQVGGTPSAGGYTVPTPVSATIIQVVEEVSVAMRTARIWPMTSATLSIPKVLSGQTVYYPGEATAITESETVWGNVALAAVKKATLTKISTELMEDSLINFADVVATRAAYELARQLDNEYINGDGGAGFGSVTGLIAALVNSGTLTLAATNTAWSDITLENFNQLMGLLPDRFYVDGPSSTLVPCCWIMSRQFHASVAQKLLYAQGGNTVSDTTSPTGFQLFGYPIYFTSLMPADAAGNIACFFGNFMEAAALGMRRDVSIAQSDQFAFNEDVLTVRTTMRSDINIHEPGVADTSAGAYVGMALAAV